MKIKYFFFFFLLYGIIGLSQTRIKVMAYNLMHYPGTTYYNSDTGNYEDRTPILKEILDGYQPDIFMVSELENTAGASQILYESLFTEDNHYQMAEFEYNHSSSYTGLQQMLYYNSDKLTLNYQDVVITNIRDINHYSLSTNTIPPIYLDVFVAHLKASYGVENEYKRLYMVEDFTSYLEGLPNESNIMIAGDFNFYSSFELGYRELLDVENNILLVDPIDTPGDWHNNSSFTQIHTQSPLQSNWHFQSQSGGSDGVTGGLDDRFDFILISENMQDGADITYVPDTYKSYGNNGNCFNNDINDSDCDGEYTDDVRNLLHNMSDHIPVVMELETALSINTIDAVIPKTFSLLGSNIVENSIQLVVDSELIGSPIEIYNPQGQLVLKKELFSKIQTISIANLNSGMFYLTCPQNSLHSPIKFIVRQ